MLFWFYRHLSPLHALVAEKCLEYAGTKMPLAISALDERLQKLRHEAEERDAKRRAEKDGVVYLDVATAPVKVEALKMIPEDRARRINAAVFEFKSPVVALAAYEPEHPEVQKLIAEFAAAGKQVKVFAVSMRGLEHLWRFYQFVPPDKAPITSRVNIEKERVIALTGELQKLASVTKAVESFDPKQSSVTEFLEVAISGALANRASDIHFEPEEKKVKLRYRIDGVLHDVAADLGRDLYGSIVSRIKLLANLKINVSDRPQDGRFTIGLPAKDIELRIALAPAEYGEIIVMRVLDPDVINLTLPQLGLRQDDLEIIKTELQRPNGMILNTGPTGSGKTSTLYAFLRTKLSPEVKIVTIEDPIEYHLEGVEQTQVDEEAGYTFGNGLRSIMRQDPDSILIGEIRDKETAEIAIQAALTGHLVFSTIHANEASGAIPRLLDLGVRATSIGPALNLIIAQRLVRRLCEHCKQEKNIAPDMRAKIEAFMAKLPDRVDKTDLSEPRVFSANKNGCEACNGSGYKGRIAIFELLLNDPEYEKLRLDAKHQALASEAWLENLIVKQAGGSEIESQALRRGMVTMQQDGVLKVLAGITTFEEVAEVTGPIAWLTRA